MFMFAKQVCVVCRSAVCRYGYKLRDAASREDYGYYYYYTTISIRVGAERETLGVWSSTWTWFWFARVWVSMYMYYIVYHMWYVYRVITTTYGFGLTRVYSSHRIVPLAVFHA